METTKTETMLRETVDLTATEVNKIKKMVLGYGNFKRMAIRLEMPATTLRDVINKGYGEPATIVKIRRAFADQAANVLTDNQ